MESATLGRPLPGRLAGWLVLVLALSALNYAAYFAGEEPPDDVAYRYSSSIAALVQFTVMFGILLLIARGLPFQDAFGLRAPSSWGVAIGLVPLTLLATWIASAIYAQFLDAGEEQGLVPDGWDSSRVGAFAAYFVAVAILAPVVEELMYRGLGYRLLVPYGTSVAVVVTGLLFGAAHGLLIGFPILSLFGILLGWLRSKTGSVYPCIFVHAIFNATALIVSVTLA